MLGLRVHLDESPPNTVAFGACEQPGLARSSGGAYDDPVEPGVRPPHCTLCTGPAAHHPIRLARTAQFSVGISTYIPTVGFTYHE